MARWPAEVGVTSTQLKLDEQEHAEDCLEDRHQDMVDDFKRRIGPDDESKGIWAESTGDSDDHQQTLREWLTLEAEAGDEHNQEIGRCEVFTSVLVPVAPDECETLNIGEVGRHWQMDAQHVEVRDWLPDEEQRTACPASPWE